MKGDEHDPSLATAYATLDRGHDMARERLLADLRGPTMSRRTNDLLSGRRPAWQVAALRAAVALAAIVTLAVGLWGLSFALAPAPAFALTGLPERLLTVRALHVKGQQIGYSIWSNAEGKSSVGLAVGSDFEERYERPARFLIRGDRKDRPVSHRKVSDGQRYVWIVDDRVEARCDATLVDDYRFAAELHVEQGIQQYVLDSLLGGGVAGYREVGRERVGDVDAVVYDRRTSEGRYVVWLNPSNGLPVKVVNYMLASDGAEYLKLATDVLTFDEPAPADAFAIPPIPAEAHVRRLPTGELPNAGGVSRRVGDPSNPDFPGNSVMGEFSCRFAFSLDGPAVLLAWTHGPEARPGAPAALEPDLSGPFGRRMDTTARSADGAVRYALFHLRDDRQPDGRHVRWALAVPDRADLASRDNGIVLNVPIDGTGARMDSHDIRPLRLSGDQCSRFVREAQRATAPADLPADQYFTVAGLRELLGTLPR